MNVLLASAGFTFPDIADTSVDYVDMSELTATVREEFAYDSLRTLRGHVDTILSKQLLTGKPTEHGELLIGGKLLAQKGYSNSRDDLYCERVERSTLGVIINTYRIKQRVAKFLESIASSAT